MKRRPNPLTVEEAAEKFGVHPDRIRKYLRLGLLEGTKLGEGRSARWRIPATAEFRPAAEWIQGEASVTLPEVARRLGKSVDRVRRLVRSGKITGEKIGSNHGGEWRVRESSIPKRPAEIPSRQLRSLRNMWNFPKNTSEPILREMMRRGLLRNFALHERDWVEAMAYNVLQHSESNDRKLLEEASHIQAVCERSQRPRLHNTDTAAGAVRYILAVMREGDDYDETRVLHYLRLGPKTVEQLAKLTRRAARTAQRTIHRLMADGVVETAESDSAPSLFALTPRGTRTD